jgi:hypothetical protein
VEDKIYNHLNKITICSDGDIRRLLDTDDRLLYYEVPIDIERGIWMKLSGTYRGQVEDNFLNGKIVSLDECLKIMKGE